MLEDFLRSLLENAGVMLGYGKSTGRTNEPISDAKSVSFSQPPISQGWILRVN